MQNSPQAGAIQQTGNNTLGNLVQLVDQIRQACWGCGLFPPNYFVGYSNMRIIYPTQVIIGGPFNGQRRATMIEARLNQINIGGGQRPQCWPPGIRSGVQAPGLAVVARGHLLADALGGPGSCDNLVPVCQSVNQDMYNRAESIVLARVQQGRVVDYQVSAEYETLSAAVPSSITVRAMWTNPDGSCGMVGPFTFENETNLRKCR
jgi:hypothetical protein